MNGKMLAHPATQANLQTLIGRGYHIIEPDSGMLACGYEGRGKLAAVANIVDYVLNFFRVE
jgi:phosphopantothenoylcysteine synthetase/decarboxylase